MLIKKTKLAEIYGIEEQISLEPIIVEDLAFKQNGHLETQLTSALDPDFEKDAHVLIEARVNELLEAKEREIARHKESILKQINQELEKARAEAELIRSTAKTEAENQNIMIQAEYVKLEKQKYEQQRIIEQERIKAFDEAMVKADVYIKELMQILGNFYNFKRDVLNEAKEEIASLALDVARQILKVEPRLNPNLLEEQVKNAISKVSVSSGLLRLDLNPADLKHASYLEQALAKILDKTVKVHFEANEKVDIGSTLVNTQGGRLNASFTSQLALIKVAFERYLGHKIIDLPEAHEIGEQTMTLDPKKLSKALAQFNDEPSDDELAMLEETDLENFEMDDDMDTLLQDILNSDADVQEDSSVKIDDDIPLAKAEAPEEDFDDDDDIEFEEFDEFADETDLGDDSNFDSADSDERFPDY